MFPDLQTDPDFPAWAETADPSALQAQESMMRQNEVAEFLMQWTPTEITDRDGQRWWVLARPSAAGDSDGSWNLTQIAGTRFTMSAGRIYSDEATADSVIAIGNANATLDFGPDRLIYIRLVYDANGLPVMTLECGEIPDKWPSVYLFTETPLPPKVTEARFEFWRGYQGTLPVGEDGIQYDRWYAKRYPRTPDLVLSQGGYSQSADYQFIPVPTLKAR